MYSFVFMPRIMGIDYGAKRVGIAVTDSLKIIPNALDTVRKVDVFDFLDNYLSKEEVEAIVVGEPIQKDGSPSAIEGEIKGFIRNFKKRYPHIAVHRQDERFTSSIAQRSLVESGVKKSDRRNKALVDQVAAVILLASFLDRRQF